MSVPTQKDALDFVRVRWPNKVDVQSRINKVVEECGEVMGTWIKMNDGTARKTRDDLMQETAQLSICVKALSEAVGFDLAAEEAAEWERCNRRVWPGTPVVRQHTCTPGLIGSAYGCPACGLRDVDLDIDPPAHNDVSGSTS